MNGPVDRAGDGSGEMPSPVRAIRVLCASALELVPATGAAVSVMTEAGHAGRIHATDPVAARLDEAQFELGEGPAWDAFQRGYPVLVPDLAAAALAGRWPGFTPAARATGARAVFVLPLHLGAIRVGALLLYRSEPGELDEAGLAQALRTGDSITYALVNLVRSASADHNRATGVNHDTDMGEGEVNVVVAGMQEDTYRAVVHQAVGMLSLQLGVSLDEALARLRAHAFVEGVPLTEIARAVVERRLRLEPT